MKRKASIGAEPEHVLTLDRELDAPVEKLWRCWTEPGLLEQWFCPKPWYVSDVRLDPRPGGEFFSVMNGPNGESFENAGVYLEVEPRRRLVSTDAFRPGWIPSGRAFMVAETIFEDAGGGRTRYIARAMHWDRATLEEHERMGFHEGWGMAADQLEALARSLPNAEAEPENEPESGPEPGPEPEPPPSLAPSVSTCLWFDGQALPAAEFYCTLLPGSRIERIRYSPEDQDKRAPGTELVVDFTLAGTPYMALNGGPRFTLDEAVSISVTTENQAETDRLWHALISGGGAESRCGWLQDRFGLSWQIVPKRAVELLNGPEAAKTWPALLKMRKIEVAALEAAAAAASHAG